MANLLPDVKKWGIRSAATVIAASLLYQARDLVSDKVLILAGAVGGLTVLCWLFGIGLTEIYKRAKHPDRKTWKTDEVRNSLWLVATAFSGIPLTVLMLMYFWPPTAFGGALITVASVGAGSLQPFVYNFISDILWPMIRRSLVAMKFVVKGDKIVSVPEDTPPDEYDHTVMDGQPTVPKDPKDPPSAE